MFGRKILAGPCRALGQVSFLVAEIMGFGKALRIKVHDVDNLAGGRIEQRDAVTKPDRLQVRFLQGALKDDRKFRACGRHFHWQHLSLIHI